MPVIFTKPSSSRGGGGSLYLGSPSDGTYDDGLLSLTPTTLTSDAVDWINEVLSALAPDSPGSLAGTNLVGNRTMRTGKVPTGLNTVWYQDGVSAGDTLSRITEYGSITLQSADQSDRFGPGNEGLLTAQQNTGTGFSDLGTLDIDANFDDTVVGPDVQDLSTWDSQGSGDPCTNGIVSFTGGNLEVTYCGWHNSFDYWQRMNAEINMSSLPEGFSAYRLHHDITSTTYTTNSYKIWHDDDTNSLSFSVSPSVVEKSFTSSKYLSGVRYYSVGDTFELGYTAENVYRKCYHVSQVSRYSFEAMNSSVSVNPSSTPHYTDSLTVSGELMVADRSNYYDLNTRVTVTLQHPWKSSVNQTSPSENRLYSGYGNVSTATHEYFEDENYRLPAGSYSSIPGSITGQWNSQTTLSSGQALVYNEGVQYPDHDLTGTLPTGNPDYSSGFSGNQYYYRAFYDSDPHSNVNLTVDSIGGVSDISEVGTGDLNVEVKLPTQTGWLDAKKSYSIADFTGADGDGCLVTAAGDTLQLTFGGFSTAFSGYMIIVRVTFRNTNKFVSSMNVNW